MVNAWSLLDSEINGTMDEDYPIMYGPDDEERYVKNKKQEGKSDYYFDYDRNGDMPNPFSTLSDNDDQIAHHVGAAQIFKNSMNHVPGGMGEDHISFSVSGGEVDDVYAYHYPDTDSKPEPNLDFKAQKYEEEEGIKDLRDYISSTYSGHYTSEQNSTQTLDLIQSVGDAESFCRSNAIKYLARYDKKGQAKRDILKAMHYCLLLYYFSGHTNNETQTRGYETF
jgi:hypothetical protein